MCPAAIQDLWYLGKGRAAAVCSIAIRASCLCDKSPQPTLHNADLGPASGEVTHWPRVTPHPWFLPGPIRIRGGLARHFASAWLFHRGIHFVASLVGGQNKAIQLQRVERKKLALRVDS